MSMAYWPPALRLAQVSAMKDGGNPFLEIDALSVPLDLGSLLRLKFVPIALQLVHVKLMISRKADGHWDVADWFSGLSSGKENPNAYPVTWTEGEIHWQDSYANPPQDMVLGTLSGAWDPAKGTLNTGGDFAGLGSRAHLTFAGGAQGGDIQLTDRGDSCAIRVENKSGAWDIKGVSTQWPLDNALTFLKFYGRSSAKNVDAAKGLELHNWQFHLTAAPAIISFEHSAGISGGLSEAKGTIENGPDGMSARLQGEAKDVPVQGFLAAAGEDLALSGQVTFIAKDVQIALFSGTTALQAGQGYAELKGGHYLIPQVSLKRLSRAKSMTYFKKKFPDLEISGIPISRMSAHWRVKDGLITAEDGLLTSTDIKTSWAGKIDSVRRGVDVTLRLEIHERNPKLRSLVPPRYQGQPAFGRLQGTWQEWLLRSIPANRIPSGLQARLRKAINQK